MSKPEKNSKLPSLSLFYPCYNEESNIEDSILVALQVLPNVAENFEIIVVDDGSRDKTREKASKLAEIHKQVQVVSHEKNKGYGAALKTGFSNAEMEWVFFTDGDLQFDLTDLKTFLPYTKDFSVIIGYRISRAEGKQRALNAKLFKLLVDLLFWLKVKDIDCAFKLFRREVFDDITLESDGAFINAELLIKLKQKGHKFKQLPVKHLPRKHGKPTGANIKVIFKGLREAFSFYFRQKLSLFPN